MEVIKPHIKREQRPLIISKMITWRCDQSFPLLILLISCFMETVNAESTLVNILMPHKGKCMPTLSPLLKRQSWSLNFVSCSSYHLCNSAWTPGISPLRGHGFKGRGRGGRLHRGNMRGGRGMMKGFGPPAPGRGRPRNGPMNGFAPMRYCHLQYMWCPSKHMWFFIIWLTCEQIVNMKCMSNKYYV